MQSVGQKLRNAREAQGRTLEQVNSATRISIKILQAIETDEIGAISSSFQYKSFVRQFAEYLNLDYADLQPAVSVTTERIPAPLVPGQVVNETPHVAALQFGGRGKLRWISSISAFALAVVACSGVYAFWQKSKLDIHSVWQATARIQGVAGSSQSPAHSSAAASNTPPSAPDGAASASRSGQLPMSAAQAAGFTLELSATEPAWLSIIADGKVSFKGILERAETKVLEGYRTARIRTGNAGGVEVIFNGKSLGALGSRGQVRTVVFTRNEYEVLEKPGVRTSLVGFSRTVELSQLAPLRLFPGF